MGGGVVTELWSLVLGDFSHTHMKVKQELEGTALHPLFLV